MGQGRTSLAVKNKIFNSVPYTDRSDETKKLLETFRTQLARCEKVGNDFYTTRIPLVGNLGYAGTGKTVNLQQNMEVFTKEYPGSKSIYITFNDDQTFDEGKEGSQEEERLVAVRILHRVHQHVNGESSTFRHFRTLHDLDLKNALKEARSLLGMEPQQHLLIAVDEVSRLGPQRSVLCLHDLCSVVTDSFQDRCNNQDERGVTFIVASAYKAVDAVTMTTKMSQRELVVQSLWPIVYDKEAAATLQASFPNAVFPLSTKCDNLWKDLPAGTAFQVRGALWNIIWRCAGHPRTLANVLPGFEKQPRLDSKTKTEDINEWYKDLRTEAASPLERKPGGISVEHATVILKWLFQRIDMTVPEPESEEAIILNAQTKGYLSLVDPKKGTAAVIVRPCDLSILCKKVARAGRTDCLEFVGAVRGLAKYLKEDLFQLKSFIENYTEDPGKFFESVLYYTLVSAMLTRSEFQLEELFVLQSTVSEDLQESSWTLDSYTIVKEKHVSFPFAFKDEGRKVCKGTRLAKKKAPFTIPPKTMHKYAPVDFVLHLKEKAGDGSCCVYVQCKEWAKPSQGNEHIVDAFRKNQKTLKKYHGKELPGAQFIHVLASVIPLKGEFENAKHNTGNVCPEAYIDLHELRTWCPTASQNFSMASKLLSGFTK